MKKNKNISSRRPAFAPMVSSTLRNGLLEAKKQAQQGNDLEALVKLRQLEKAYPENQELLEGMMTLGVNMEMPPVTHKAVEKLTRLLPENESYQQFLVAMCVMNGYPLLMLEAMENFVARFPKSQFKDVEGMDWSEMKATVEGFLEAEAEKMGLTLEETKGTLLCMDRLRFYVESGDTKAAVAFGKASLATYPNAPKLYTLTAEALNRLGHLPETLAVIDEAIQKMGDDSDLLCALTAQLVRVPKTEGSNATRLSITTSLSEKLRALAVPTIIEADAVAEAMAWLHEDDGILLAFNTLCPRGVASLPKESALTEETSEAWAHLCHLAACVYARQGDKKKAKTLWERAYGYDDGLQIIEDNLEDMKRPQDEQGGPWYFTLQDILTEHVMAAFILSISPQLKNSKNTFENALPIIREFMAEYPELLAAMPTLLSRGNKEARMFVLMLGEKLAFPEITAAMQAFVMSDEGSDKARMTTLHVLQGGGILQESQPISMQFKGEQRDVVTMEWKIVYEPLQQYPISARAQKLFTQAHTALQRDNFKKAEDLCREALILEPNAPQIWNNLAQALSLQDKDEESMQLGLDIYEKYPDYFTGIVNRANMYRQEGDLESAKKLLIEAGKREELHMTEFINLMRSWIELWIDCRNPEEAAQYLRMLKKVYPEYPDSKEIESRLEILQMVQDAPRIIDSRLPRSGKAKP
jgi:tetratricopeptide (TPR) repeat protein